MLIIASVRVVARGVAPPSPCFLSIHPTGICRRFKFKPMASNEFPHSRTWHPEEIINATKQANTYVCMVLNRKITVPLNIVKTLWQNAAYRCTVDGGTNRWMNFLLEHDKCNELKLPDFITGDFDSVTKETLDYFQDSNTKIIKTPDQNYTDFTKAIQIIEPYLGEKGLKDIYVLHDTSGRIDHIMANIQTLYKTRADLNVYLIAGSSLTWALRPGDHTIHIPKDLVDNTRWCALLPVGCKSVATTSGLKWNLDESNTLAFETGLVSTSNSYASQQVSIKTNEIILWSMGVFNFHDD